MIAISSSTDRAPSDIVFRSAKAGSRRARHAAVLTAEMLYLSTVCAQAQEQEPPPPQQADFMDLLEYLGSWDGPEDEWLSPLGETDDQDWLQLAIESDPVPQAGPAG